MRSNQYWDKIKKEYIEFFKKHPKPNNKEKLQLYLNLLKKSEKCDLKDFVYFFKGNLEFLNGNEKSALEDHHQAISENINNPFPYNSIGLIYYNRSKISKAIEYYKKAINFDDSVDFIYYNLGKAYELFDMLKEAKRCFEHVLFLDNKNQDAINGLQNIEDIEVERDKNSITDVLTIEAIYIFADIRGFTKWSINNILEIEKLFNIFYPEATRIFGDKEYRPNQYFRRVVKFLGDGFFAINEYSDPNEIVDVLNIAITNIRDFNKSFISMINNERIPARDKLRFSFGLTYSRSQRFKFKGQYDWTGNKINLASRLCKSAQSSELLIEENLSSELDDMKIKYSNVERNINDYGKIKILSLTL